jgi:hypothetical protein
MSRDISTEDLIRAFAIAIERRVRAEDILKLETSAKNASTVKARQRDERNALRALNTHMKECVKLVGRAKAKMPAPLKRTLTGRTIHALRRCGVRQPETHTVKELLHMPGVGVDGVAAIAVRSYAPPTGKVNWPELEN